MRNAFPLMTTMYARYFAHHQTMLILMKSEIQYPKCVCSQKRTKASQKIIYSALLMFCEREWKRENKTTARHSRWLPLVSARPDRSGGLVVSPQQRPTMMCILFYGAGFRLVVLVGCLCEGGGRAEGQKVGCLILDSCSW